MGSLLLALTALLGAGSGMDALKEGFASPPPEFSPVPIWWWSGDKIEREGITQQIEQLAQARIHNAIILNLAPSGPLYGSAADDPPFLTEEWWNLFGFAVSECKRFGVRLWFYDQLGFSGAGLQARVVREHPEFRAIDLQRVYQDLDSAGQARLSVPAGGTALAAFVASVPSTGSERPTPQWIWDGGALKAPGTRYFRAEITLEQAPKQASLVITCDNGYALYVNGQEVGRELIHGATGWGTGEPFDLAALLHTGENVIAVTAENLVGDAGLLLDMTADDQPVLVSGTAFRVSKEAPEGWLLPGFDASGWDPPAIIGGYPCAPWGPIANFRYGQGMMGIKIEDVKDVSAELQENDLLLDVPEGRHRVMLFYTAPAGFDYQNPDAGAALLDVVHGEMERRFGKELGKGIGGSFQDEFPALPRFSARFLKEFERREGYDLLGKLPALFDEVADRFGEPEGPTTAQIRVAASDVAAELCEKAFFIPLHKWHERHGMLCGYDQTVRNADPIRGEKYYIDYFDTMRHYSAPGSDMDGDAKPHQAMADLYGRPRVWIEAFHSSGWGQTLEEIATLLHPWLLNGATLYNPHAIYYSIHGSYYEWAPPDTGWRQPYFVHNKTFADYTA
ncbi:MAG: hypothetical protein HYZ00_09795, partial [Candidatus Hydrogenedentes bacterium]|nr:hypothetical protein [Candidatus Hydrogenedentota bacterium]